jgi:hypothetical protein
MIGPRDAGTAAEFMRDVASRLANRVQLTTDGLRAYLTAVDYAFGTEIDFATLTKICAGNGDGRYSPPVCIGCLSNVVTGDPDVKHISTSYVERSNLTMRMGMRRFTRLTNGHSKKLINHAAAVAMHFMHYNFVRIHETLRVTPAMAAGLTTTPWEAADLVNLLETAETQAVA